MIDNVSLVFNLGQSQKIYKNDDYTFNSQNFTISIVLYLSDSRIHKDSINNNFGKFFETANQKTIISNITSSDTLLRLLATNFSVLKSSKQLRRNPNLFEGFSEREIEIFRTGFLQSDLLIMTSAIDRKSVYKVSGSGNKKLSSLIDIYDLAKGTWIGRITYEVKKKYHTITESEIGPLDELIDYFAIATKELLTQNK